MDAVEEVIFVAGDKLIVGALPVVKFSEAPAHEVPALLVAEALK
jgi:hypothetical protein